MLKKAKIFRRTKIIIGKPFELDEYYGKKLGEQDIMDMAKVVREKMIEQQEILKNMTKKV